MQILPLILGAMQIFEKVGAYIGQLRETARQNGELTPEQDAALDARMAKTISADHWKSHDPAGPGD